MLASGFVRTGNVADDGTAAVDSDDVNACVRVRTRLCCVLHVIRARAQLLATNGANVADVDLQRRSVRHDVTFARG
jgi:hypothetical protein